MAKRRGPDFGDCATDRIDILGQGSQFSGALDASDDEAVTARLLADDGDVTRPQRPARITPRSTEAYPTVQPRQKAARRLDPAWLRELPRISTLEARWTSPASAPWRAALRARAHKAVSHIAQALCVDLSLEGCGVSLEDHPSAGFRVIADHGEGQGVFEARICPLLSASLLEALTKSPVAPLVTHPDPVTGAVLGHGALLICKALGEAGIIRPRLLTKESISPALCIEIALTVGGSIGHAQIALDEAAARALTLSLETECASKGSTESTKGRLDPSTSQQDFAGLCPTLSCLEVETRLCLGPIRLPVSTIESLQPGDALCPDPAARIVDGLPKGPGHLIISSRPNVLAATGRIEGRTFSIDSLGLPRPTSEEPAMEHVSSTTAALAVDVHIVLETIPMTIAELGRLGPGSVLTLFGPCPRVKLRVGEETIAVGELVDVEGVLGVRIIDGALR